jgi:hypothetical protein
VSLKLQVDQRQVEIFSPLLQSLSEDKYYVSLVATFPAIDALTKDMFVQPCVILDYPIKGVKVFNQLAALYLTVYWASCSSFPSQLATGFEKQLVLTVKAQAPAKLCNMRLGLSLASTHKNTTSCVDRSRSTEQNSTKPHHFKHN